MASKVVMAQLSPTMEEGRLVEWKVDEGEEVAQGDVVAEIETDKANMDVESMGAGVLRKQIVEAGRTVPVGVTIGVIADPDEDISGLLEEVEAEGAGAGDGGEPGEEAAEEAPEEDGAEAGAAEGDGAEEEREVGAARRTGAGPAGDGRDAGRVKASPVARRMAEEGGLELSRVEGSGPAGRIVKRDVEAALERRGERPAGAPAGASPLTEERVELSQMRKAIARRLSQSIGPVPHFYLTREIGMGRALALRADLNERRGGGTIGVNDLLLKATAEALARHPEINASWDEDAIVRHGSVDLGIAVAVDEGLITPVLRDAETKGLEQIAEESAILIERARERDLQPEEYQGATFSISNLGMMGIDEFTAVINPPEAAILAVGKTQEKPVAADGEVEIRSRMRITMSCDHRVIDGAMGARFLDTFTAMLENPLEMLM